MPDADSDDVFESADQAFDDLFDIEDEAIYDQWRAERWIMELLLTPAKNPRPRTADELINVVDNGADAAVALTALECDGLVQHDDNNNVSATKAAVSFWRLELTQAGPLL
jgi:hypothetical protein